MKPSKMSLRRLRQSSAIRELTREVRLSSTQFVQPCFVVEGLSERAAVPGLSGVHRETPDSLNRQIELDLEAGVRKFLLFAVPREKRLRDFDPGFCAEQIFQLRRRFGVDLWLAADVCLCSSTEHGHCGILDETQNHVDNGATVEALAEAAVAYAQAGANAVAPSDMMDGRVASIRGGLDARGLEQTLIMSYSVKFHSRFYGPFRLAAASSPKGVGGLKDRSSYQIDPARPSDAWMSAERDAAEGADILMVKPGLPYLDILRELSARIHKPWAVYETSGEYAAIELLAREGLAQGPGAHVESWTALARAGAQILISYGARQARQWLREFSDQGV